MPDDAHAARQTDAPVECGTRHAIRRRWVPPRERTTVSEQDLVRRHRESLFPIGRALLRRAYRAAPGRGPVRLGRGGEPVPRFLRRHRHGLQWTCHSGDHGPIKDQLDRITHSSTLFLIRSQIELAERIREMTPPQLDKVLFVNSGTEANEAAFLVTTLNRNSNELIALRHSYHGRSFATINASGQRPGAQPPSRRCTCTTPQPVLLSVPAGTNLPQLRFALRRRYRGNHHHHHQRTPGGIHRRADPGRGRVHHPAARILRARPGDPHRHGIPFIADEVQTAWGRMGVADFGFQAYGISPMSWSSRRGSPTASRSAA